MQTGRGSSAGSGGEGCPCIPWLGMGKKPCCGVPYPGSEPRTTGDSPEGSSRHWEGRGEVAGEESPPGSRARPKERGSKGVCSCLSPQVVSPSLSMKQLEAAQPCTPSSPAPGQRVPVLSSGAKPQHTALLFCRSWQQGPSTRRVPLTYFHSTDTSACTRLGKSRPRCSLVPEETTSTEVSALTVSKALLARRKTQRCHRQRQERAPGLLPAHSHPLQEAAHEDGSIRGPTVPAPAPKGREL